MSMLTRKGTMVRKNRGSLKRSHGRRMQSGNSQQGVSSGSIRSTGSVKSGGGITAIRGEITAQNSPARSVTSTVVSFDDQRQLYKTTVDWRNGAARGGDLDQHTHYGSMFLHISEAKKESDTICDFIRRINKIICHTAFVTVLVGISTALPITMLSVGVKYLNDCPKQRKVPVYLLVGGCFGIIKVLGTVWHNIQSRRYDDHDVFYEGHSSDGAASRTYRMMDVLLSLFLVVWLVSGTYWVFSIWEPHYTQLLHEPSNWCDRTVYLFAAYQIVGCYAFMSLVFLFWIILTLCFKCTSNS